MSQQLPLTLPLPTPATLDDFIFADDGQLADLLTQQREHSQPLLYLHGPQASGKTHLLLGQCSALQSHGAQIAYLPCQEHATLHPSMLDNLEQLDLIAIDDVQALAGWDDWEQALFHLFNRARERGCQLLFSSDVPPGQLTIELADLRSRLSWGLAIKIPVLDDQARQQLLTRLAQRRGLEMPGAVARYLIERQPRGNQHLVALIEQLDQASLSAQRRLSIPFVREHLKG